MEVSSCLVSDPSTVVKQEFFADESDERIVPKKEFVPVNSVYLNKFCPSSYIRTVIKEEIDADEVNHFSAEWLHSNDVIKTSKTEWCRSEEQLDDVTSMPSAEPVTSEEKEAFCEINKDVNYDKYNQTVSNLITLKGYKSVHNGIKQSPYGDRKKYVCDTCDKAFTTSSSLNRHKVLHTGIKNHICDFCNKAFARSSNLRAHKERHSDIKKHVCDICNKPFNSLNDLFVHISVHRRSNDWECDLCNQTFSTKEKCLKHIQKMHYDRN